MQADGLTARGGFPCGGIDNQEPNSESLSIDLCIEQYDFP
jgi:glutathione peroxidase-family protein